MNARRLTAIAMIVLGAACTTWAVRATHDSPVSQLVTDRIEELKVGDPQAFGSLTMFPLIGRTNGGFEYLTLDEAMDRELIQVGEKGSGEVNKIVIRNGSGERVFIMDGEEIIGAKQNRVLNSSVMIAPKQIAEVPVSCVEQGRWVKVSEGFKSGRTQLFSKARQANAAEVSRNYAARPSAGAQSNQAEIWDRVASKRSTLAIPNPSGPMHEVYQKYDKDISDYVKHFKAVPDQVGTLFAINGEIIGADIFDQHRTLDKLFTKLVKSYALDAIEHNTVRRVSTVDREDARDFVRRILGRGVSFRDYASAGEGRDVRIVSNRINGASLVAGNRAVHTTLFASEDAAPVPVKSGEIRPASQRRQRR